MAKFIIGVLVLFVSVSCSVEKVNLSPIGSSLSGGGSSANEIKYGIKKEMIIYSSEITNLVATFPKFRNDAVNAEVKNLKFHLKDYIGSMEAFNMNGLNMSKRQYEKSYKKIQNLRKYLSHDDDMVLNRYLVRIKTNMTLLENNLPKDSLSSR